MAKIIFFDIDGTLRGFTESGIRPSVYRAIEAARAAGVLCFVASGRHPLEIKEENLLGDLVFDGGVYLNGSYAADTRGRILHHTPIPASQVKALIDLRAAEDFSLMLMEADAMYIDRWTPHVQKMQDSVHTRVPPVVSDLAPSISKTIYQMVIYGDNPTLERVMTHIPLCSPTRWTEEGGALDVTPLGGNKCNAIRAVLDHYGIPLSEAAAVGDGFNDEEMLRMVGTGVAMGDACEPTRRAARCVAPDIDADGLYWAVNYILNH